MKPWFLLLAAGAALAGRIHDDELRVRTDAVATVLRTSAAVPAAVRTIQGMLLSAPTYTRPIGSFLQHVLDYQPVPALPGSEDLLVSVREHILPHIEAAKALSHPRASAGYAASQDIIDAARNIMSFGGNAQALTEWRDNVESTLSSLRPALMQCEESLRDLMSPAARNVLQGDYSLSLMACIRMAIGSPDELFTAHQICGFPCLDDYPDSGMFREREKPATQQYDELCHEKHNQDVDRALRNSAADARQYDALVQLTQKTRAEVLKGQIGRAHV
jgi:hypothetical protein